MKVLSLSATQPTLIFGTTPGKTEKVIAALHLWNGKIRMHCGFANVFRDLMDRLAGQSAAPQDADEAAFLEQAIANTGILNLLRERFPGHEISYRIDDCPL